MVLPLPFSWTLWAPKPPSTDMGVFNVGNLSANDRAELERVTGKTFSDMGSMGDVETHQFLATAWWLQERRDDAGFTLDEALDTPLKVFLPDLFDAGGDDDGLDPPN